MKFWAGSWGWSWFRSWTRSWPRSWGLPLLAGVLMALVTWAVTVRVFPFALMHVATVRIGGDMAPNSFRHAKPATPDNQPIVRPSPDLLYSSCVFDLADDVSGGVVLVDVEPIADHYWSVSVFDARTDTVIVRGEREVRGQPVRLALMRQDPDDRPPADEPPAEDLPARGALPADYERVHLDYDRGIVLLRILVPDTEALADVDRRRRLARCRPA